MKTVGGEEWRKERSKETEMDDGRKVKELEENNERKVFSIHNPSSHPLRTHQHCMTAKRSSFSQSKAPTNHPLTKWPFFICAFSSIRSRLESEFIEKYTNNQLNPGVS